MPETAGGGNGNRSARAAPERPLWCGRYLLRMRSLALLLLAGALLSSLSACTDLDTRVDGVRTETEELTDRARFCLAVTRATTAIESGSPATAREAADEVLAQAPDDLEPQAREVVELLATAAEQGDAELRDPALRSAADELRADAAPLCDPSR